MSRVPVAVRAFGATTALGETEAGFEALCRGEVGGGPAPAWFEGHGPVAPIRRVFPAGSHRTSALALHALTSLPALDPSTGLVFATTTSGMLEGEEAIFSHFGGAPPQKPVDFFWNNLAHQPGMALAQQLGLLGPRLTISTACTSGTVALGAAMDLIQSQRTTRVLVVGCDTLCRTTLFGFKSFGAYTKTSCKPFDQARDGMWLGEAAAWMLLEAGDGPLQLLGCGVATDASHLTAPDPTGTGLARAITRALAGTPGEAVDHVNAHATGTEINDPAEVAGIQAACPRAYVSATKGATGHTLGAAGMVEAVFLAQSLQHQVIPGVTGLENPLPGLSLSPTTRNHPQRVGVSVNLAFGGHNAAVALRVHP